MNTLETLREIVRRIEEFNRTTGEDAIPTSDDLFRKHMNDLAESQDQLLFRLRILQDAHFLFTIHIVEPDTNKGTPGIYGYVVADPQVVQPLIAEFNRRLEYAYESQMGKRKGAPTIIREMMVTVKDYQNSPLGKVLHLSIMLDQFNRLLNDKPEEYTTYWREVQLRQLMPELQGEGGIAGGEAEEEEEEEEAGESPFQAGPGPQQTSRRAIDTEEYQELSRMDLTGSWGKAVEKYGVTFLMRIHLRKNEFDMLKKLIYRHRIAREEDLRYLRDTLRLMEDRFSLDRDLIPLIPQIREIKRLAQLKLNQFTLIRKKFDDELDV